MKALTLTQPWATAVALGSKRLETRAWSTNYRGPIAIHAAKGYKVGELLWLGSSWSWVGALWGAGLRMGKGPSIREALPFGAIVAIATLESCRPSEELTVGELDSFRSAPGCDNPHLYTWTERQMGNYAPGRFVFGLRSVVMLQRPVPVKGALGLWNIPPAIEAQLHEQVGAAAA